MFQMIKVWIKNMKYYWSHEKCYDERESEGNAVFGNCSGLSGGSRETNYLNEDCVGCPHFTL